MKIKEAINWLEYKPRFKEKTDLSKMKNALKILGNPEKNFKTIHITGTNGKGSVAHSISTVLSKEKKVGLFTSPYVVRFNERLQINNFQIEDEKLLKYIVWAKEFDENYFKVYQDKFSFFELLTLIAVKYFSDEKVDYAIIEVGIGGRLDATNVIDGKYSVITSVGLDHVNQLGDTLEEILKEKLAILKENQKLFTAVDNFDELILKDVKKKNAQLTLVRDNDFRLLKSFPLTFEYKKVVYTPGLQGLYQIKNVILAINVLNEIIEDKDLIKEGINETINPGRFEVLNKNPYIILDGAHNYEAIDKLSISLKEIFKDKKIKVLYTSMEDKPYIKMIERLSKLTNEIYLTSLNFPRALNNFDDPVFKGYKVLKDPLEAFVKIKDSLSEGDVLVVTGSMYLVSLIRSQIKKI